ncbi:MAG: aminotransferase class I/II-fold pyridoxal phosphate-dependent enzyme [Nitrososphaeria archaeon]|nr:aminotransferase class I/II-fold pyridoxal phosphate-dependent enzyme [Conexivisphaerales archaeon]
MIVRFEIGEWIESHRAPYDLMQSGLSGRIDLSKYFSGCGFEEPEELKKLIAEINGTDVELVSLTHGATEAVAIVAKVLKLSGIKEFDSFVPEYEMLYKAPLAENMKKGKGALFLSDPNNPTSMRTEIPEGYKYYVVDETFLQFMTDLDKVKRRKNTFRINTFTKFYGGDEVRIGYIISPDVDLKETIENLQGITYEPVSRHNICVAKKILEDNDKVKEEARMISTENFEILERNMDKLKFYMNKRPQPATVVFLDYSDYSSLESLEISEMLYKKGVSVVPATMFGKDSYHFRVAYTRKNFEDSINALVNALKSIKAKNKSS